MANKKVMEGEDANHMQQLTDEIQQLAAQIGQPGPQGETEEEHGHEDGEVVEGEFKEA